ncbi:MAG: site-specific DNA-methyltransferase [Pseudomonadota bacterium]
MRRQRAINNRTTYVSDDERKRYNDMIVDPESFSASMRNVIICADVNTIASRLPTRSVDLLFLDPPYNLSKRFGKKTFRKHSLDTYESIFEAWFIALLSCLKPTASVYVCCDWSTSPAIFSVLNRYLTIRNRITWEREKGRSSLTNWKNCSEDIWFATISDKFTFNVDAVKMKRKVLAPYRQNGKAKDWTEEHQGKFLITHPSNLWTDITVPFWSMLENTDHPTQKPEKLVAKIALASTNEGDLILDPFLGSGTTSVVAQKLRRSFIGIEIDKGYCCLAAKRLEHATRYPSIQGYFDGMFWERNSLSDQSQQNKRLTHESKLFLRK